MPLIAPVDSNPTSRDTSHLSKSRYRWIMLGGLWLAYTSFGLILGGIPPLVIYLSEDLNLSRSAMGSVLGAWPLIYIAFSIPAGALIDRFGLNISLTLGIILIAISGFLRALAVSHVTLFLAVAVFGLGGPFISIGAPKLISAWFEKKDRGAAMGIYLTAPSVGRIAALATANSLLMPLYDSNWRLTLVTYAGIAILAGLIWWVIASNAPNPDAKSRESEATRASSFRVFPQLLRSRVVQIVLIMSLGSFLFNHGLGNWLPEILRVGGMTAKQAGFWATIPVSIGLIAILVIPRLAIPSRRIPMLVGTLLLASASVVILGATVGAQRILSLILLGIAGRGVMPILMLMLMDSPRVGSSRMGSAGGLFFTAGEVGGVLGPLLMGVLSDVSGDFGGGLLMLASSTGFMAILALWLGVAVKREV